MYTVYTYYYMVLAHPTCTATTIPYTAILYSYHHLFVHSQVPLSIETALNRNGARLSGGSISPHALARAQAAAEKRMALLPGEWCVCVWIE